MGWGRVSVVLVVGEKKKKRSSVLNVPRERSLKGNEVKIPSQEGSASRGWTVDSPQPLPAPGCFSKEVVVGIQKRVPCFPEELQGLWSMWSVPGF